MLTSVSFVRQMSAWVALQFGTVPRFAQQLGGCHPTYFVRTAGSFFVCEWCHQACLRPSGETEARISRRDAVLRHDIAVLEFLSVMSVQQCAESDWTDASGVHGGRCLPCYSRTPPISTKRRVTCLSAIHCDLSIDKKPTLYPSPGVLPLLWKREKAADQAVISRLSREKVCPACRTLAEKLHRATAPTPPGTAAAGDCVPAMPAVLVPAAVIERVFEVSHGKLGGQCTSRCGGTNNRHGRRSHRWQCGPGGWHGRGE